MAEEISRKTEGRAVMRAIELVEAYLQELEKKGILPKGK